MGVKGGPNIPNWESYNTIFDPSSNILYPGSGFTFTNPLNYTGWTNWTMGEASTNLLAGSGVSKYVQQTSKQQFSQRIVQVGTGNVDKFTFLFVYRAPKTGTDSTIIQWQSNGLSFQHLAAGDIRMIHQNVNFNFSGLGMTDNVWRHYAYTRSGTAATMYINGIGVTTFIGLSANSTSATDTKMFDFPGCDGAIGLCWFNLGQALSSLQISQHFNAMKGRFGIS